MIKSQVQRIVREVATTQGATLTRDEKWGVFLNVCDGLYSDGRITLKQHDNWTSPFWTMITQENRDFVNFLFDKFLTETDTDMIDLHDDDTAGIDAFEFQQLELLWTTLSSTLMMLYNTLWVSLIYQEKKHISLPLPTCSLWATQWHLTFHL